VRVKNAVVVCVSCRVFGGRERRERGASTHTHTRTTKARKPHTLSPLDHSRGQHGQPE
jgi:hypothetical protein